MSKSLYIVRHAKASKEDNHLHDWERPLIEAGVERATRISRILHKKKIKPDTLISSHAFRALNTAVLFALSLDYPVNKIQIRYDIYRKTPDHLLELLRQQDDLCRSVMIFGHNPEFTRLYNLLTGEQIDTLPTSAVAGIKFEVEKWRKIEPKNGKCLLLETGK